ncbi:MAG: hypothetical protein Q8L88_15070 [Bacteroidota bacterium]|nr:hypothetical protein [Bacteroidota bacterium]
MTTLFICSASTIVSAQLEGTAGAFSRMGFGGRGIGMGNAMSAVKTGENSGYYNPASVALLTQQTVSLSYSILTLDRSLNTMFFSMPIDTNAGLAFGIINSGVSNIDGRDNDGFKTETYSVSENQFSLSFGLRIRKITIGISTKLYYYSLFKELSSTNLGFDFGIIYPLTTQLTLAGTVKDANTKYRWDTSKLYDQLGNNTKEKFPSRKSLGLSYVLDDTGGLLSAEIENSSVSTTIIRFGGEYTASEVFTIRGGIDGWNLEHREQAHPTFGFTLRTDYTDWKPSFNYAYIVEPYGVSAMHVISLSIKL